MRNLLHKAWTHLRLHDYKWKQKLQIILPIIGFLLACDVVTKVLAQTYLTYGSNKFNWQLHSSAIIE